MREAWIFTWIFYALALIPTWLVVPYPYDTLGREAHGAARPSTRPSSSTSLGLLFTFIYSAPELGRDQGARHAGQPHDRHPARRAAQGGGLGDGGARRLHRALVSSAASSASS